MKTVSKVQTPVGEFTRLTDVRYTHVVVRNSPRAMRDFQSGERQFGVGARWVKDRGYGVTWHGSEKAAQNAARVGYTWDNDATLVGIFPVSASVLVDLCAVQS